MEKILIDDFARIKYLANPTFSPKGGNFCFTVTEADKEKNEYHSHIYMKRQDELIQLTGLGKESAFFFLDEDTIIFPSNRNDSKLDGSKFYRISLKGGEASLFAEFPIGISKLIPLKDGSYLALGDYDPAWPDLYKGEEKYLEDYKKHIKDNADYEEITENPFWFNGASFTRSGRNAIYHYADGKLNLITDGKMDASNLKLSKDESFALFSASLNQHLRSFDSYDLYCLDLKDFQYRKILDHETLMVSDYEFADSQIYLTANKREYGMNTNDDFYSLSYGDFTLSKICNYGEALGSSVGSDVRYGGGHYMKVQKDVLYFISTIFDKAILRKLENGKVSDVIDFDGSVDAFDIVDDKVILVGFVDMKPQELYDGNLKQLSHFNEEVLKDKYVARPEILNFTSQNDEIHGFVLKPINYDENKKYPVILDVHGGPKTVYGPVFYHEMQYWASEGFFVIFCNPTGSDGRGNEFMDIRGKYGTIDFTDIMNFTDEALKRYPQMDKDNLFETGGSYGGFMTNWIIGHTDRFKACASQRSIANWFSFYGVSDIGIGFAADQNASTPFDNPEKLWWHSPMKYADQVKTPTLFIHSNEDYRCPMPEGMQMFSSLIAHGIDSKLVYFRGENHELSRSGKPLHRLKRLSEITEWFRKYLDDKYKSE